MAWARQMRFAAFGQIFEVVSKSHWFLYRFIILDKVIVINTCLNTYALDSRVECTRQTSNFDAIYKSDFWNFHCKQIFKWYFALFNILLWLHFIIKWIDPPLLKGYILKGPQKFDIKGYLNTIKAWAILELNYLVH